MNLNISPRGVRGGFLDYISLQEDGLPIFYNGFLEELELRRDMTYREWKSLAAAPRVFSPPMARRHRQLHFTQGDRHSGR